VLPFTGEAYFNAELEAWVGLCSEWKASGVSAPATSLASPPSSQARRLGS
jgi:hypothetical protein